MYTYGTHRFRKKSNGISESQIWLICLDCLSELYFDPSKGNGELPIEFKILEKLRSRDYQIIQYDEEGKILIDLDANVSEYATFQQPSVEG
jgi:hypothetical protein